MGVWHFLQLDFRTGAAGYAEILALHHPAELFCQSGRQAGPFDYRSWAVVQQHLRYRRLAAESEQPHSVFRTVELHRTAATAERYDTRCRLCRECEQATGRL